MYSLNWENQSALISDIIPLPPCFSSGDLSESSEVYTNFEGQLGLDETLHGALSGLHELKHCDSMINPTNPINQYIMRDDPSINCTKNSNFHKRCREEIEEYPKLQPFHAQHSSPPRVPQRFEIVFETKSRSKKLKSLPNYSINQSSCISFSQKGNNVWEPDEEAMAEVKEMIYMEAAMKPINLEFDEPIEKPKRKNVKISKDPQTVSARKRRERISERLGVLQRLVPGGDKLDTASMLDEAANYVKFLQSQIKDLEMVGQTLGYTTGVIFNPMQSVNTFSYGETLK